MKSSSAVLPSLAGALTLILVTGPAAITDAETIFTQDFEVGLGPDETVSGMFSINNTLTALNNGTMMMGHEIPYGPLGGGVTPQPSYSYYELVLDLRGFADAELRFDFSGGIEKNFDGFNLLATTEPFISPPLDLITPTAGSAFQYDAVPLTQHGQSSPELGARAWSSPADPSVVVKDLAAIFDLSIFNGEKVIIRFQFGTDALEGGDGANFDNIVVEGTALPDSDSDGMSDPWEVAHGLNPNLDDRTLDLDKDTVDNITEYNNCTDPDNPDTDGDGLSDGVETKTGTFSSSADTGSDPRIPDTDGDTLDDGEEVNSYGTDPNKEDTDGDGFGDKKEIDLGSDPTNGLDKPKVWVIESLGTGTGALIGGDLTDPEDDGVEGNVPGDGDWSSLNWNWVSIEASGENYFGNFGGSEGAYDVFDNTVGPSQAKWCCDGPPQWITVEFEKPISLESFTITSGNDVPGRDPLAWTISGSNDGVNFDLIFEQNDTISLWKERLEVLHFIAPKRSKPYKFLKYEVTQTQQDHQINEIEYFGTSTPPRIPLDIGAAGDDLVFTWESAAGQLYNLRSETDPSTGEPITWPILGVHQDIDATPPLNTLTIPRPADAARFFIIEGYPKPPLVAYQESFDTTAAGTLPPGWTKGANGGDAGTTTWELGNPAGGAATGPAAAFSPDHCFGTNIAADYVINANIWLRSPSIDLTTATGATLVFQQWVDMDDFDFGDIGTVRVLDASGLPGTVTELGVVETNIQGLDPTAWVEFSAELPVAALGKMIVLEFLMTTDNYPDDDSSGWYIDDVLVTVPDV